MPDTLGDRIFATIIVDRTAVMLEKISRGEQVNKQDAAFRAGFLFGLAGKMRVALMEEGVPKETIIQLGGYSGADTGNESASREGSSSGDSSQGASDRSE